MSKSIINFEFDSVNIVSDWNYNCVNTLCSLCNISIYEESLQKKNLKNKNIKNKNIVNTSIVMGECNHAFHRDCIKTNMKKTLLCPSCPDNKLYKFKQDLEDISSIKLFRN